MSAVQQITGWPVPHAAAAVITPDGVVDTCGPQEMVFELASVTKLLTSVAVLVALQDGALTLTTVAGPPGSTVRHLLAHTAGYEFDTDATRGAPGERRMYSNTGFEVLADVVAQHVGQDFPSYVRDVVLQPLGMTHTDVSGSPAAGARSTVADLARFAHELLVPTVLRPATLAAARTTQFPDVAGLLPGFGRQTPNPWGLGFEVKGSKSPHWTGSLNSARTFGHFGQSGTFLWVDPDRQLACVALTDRAFGQWAIHEWPLFSDAVVTEFSGGNEHQDTRV